MILPIHIRMKDTDNDRCPPSGGGSQDHTWAVSKWPHRRTLGIRCVVSLGDSCLDI